MEEIFARFEVSRLVQSWLADGAKANTAVGCSLLDEFPIFILEDTDGNNL